MFGPFVKGSVILYWSEFSIFFLDKEEIGGVGALGWADSIPSEMFFYKFSGFFNFFLSEG
jgi:hypothetical protein